MKSTDELETISWQGPDLLRQKLANHTIEAVLALPEDAPRVELVDGSMVMAPYHDAGHQPIIELLWEWLHRVHEYVHVHLGAGIALDLKNTIEPDVLMVNYLAPAGVHFFEPGDVILAVEVVSPRTANHDRHIKPLLYADAGIRHLWRVEQNPVHVHAYRLGEDGAYELVADSAEELILDEPYPIRLPIAEITP